jgi:hypothetical protein
LLTGQNWCMVYFLGNTLFRHSRYVCLHSVVNSSENLYCAFAKFNVLHASAYIYSLISLMTVITKNESLKCREAEGSYSRKWHSVPCFWVHGERLDFMAYWWLFWSLILTVLGQFWICRNTISTNLWKKGKSCFLMMKLEICVGHRVMYINDMY